MSNWLARIFDHNKEGEETESGYYIAEPDEVEAVLTAYDIHNLSKNLHEGTDEIPNVQLEEAQDKSGSWISNFFSAK